MLFCPVFIFHIANALENVRDRLHIVPRVSCILRINSACIRVRARSERKWEKKRERASERVLYVKYLIRDYHSLFAVN